jgi:hypothetical protein
VTVEGGGQGGLGEGPGVGGGLAGLQGLVGLPGPGQDAR